MADAERSIEVGVSGKLCVSRMGEVVRGPEVEERSSIGGDLVKQIETFAYDFRFCDSMFQRATTDEQVRGLLRDADLSEAHIQVCWGHYIKCCGDREIAEYDRR